MKPCSFPGCKEPLSPHQCETSEKLFGKPWCIKHEDAANAEVQAAVDAVEPPEFRVLKECGWNLDRGRAVKVIGNSETIAVEVTIDVGRLAEKGKTVLVAGYEYHFGDKDEVDTEVKKLFDALEKMKNGKCNFADEKKRENCNTPDNFKKVPESSKPEPVRSPAPVHKPDAMVPVNTFSPQGCIIKGFIPQLKEIGKIKIGRKGEKTTGTGYRLPEKFDHFEIMSLVRDDAQNFIPDPIMQQLGEKPKELSIMLLYNDPTLCFSTRYNAYKGGKCLCQGDGVMARTLIGDEVPCSPDTCEVFEKKGCKPNGILSVILTDSPRLGGVYKFRTTSYNSIRSILSSLFFLRSLTGGVLAMIPLKLTVSPMTVQPKDSATAQTIYVVNVEFAGTARQLLEKTVEVSKYQGTMRAEIQALEATARLAISAPESEEDIKETVAEFYPEQAQVGVKQ